MRIFKVFIVAFLSFSLTTTCAEAQNKSKSSKGNKAENKTSNKTVSDTPMDDQTDSSIKILAESAFSKVEMPFILAARSKETYAQMQKLIENLPAATGIDFDKQAVVAAFAGTRRTGGYSVDIRKTGEKIAIELASPPKDAMVTQALTQPFKVALVSIEAEEELLLTPSVNWTNAMQIYKISSGEFEYSGGIAGRLKKFAVEGTVGVLTLGDFVTLAFNLSGKDGDKNRKLAEIVSGTTKDGNVEIARLNVGSFSEGPKPPDKVSGTMIGDKLSLIFEPLPALARDGFSAGGKVEAVKISKNLNDGSTENIR